MTRTSIAVRSLSGNFKWALTGTPLHKWVQAVFEIDSRRNSGLTLQHSSVDELYALFAFIDVPNSHPYDVFMHNFCDVSFAFVQGISHLTIFCRSRGRTMVKIGWSIRFEPSSIVRRTRAVIWEGRSSSSRDSIWRRSRLSSTQLRSRSTMQSRRSSSKKSTVSLEALRECSQLNSLLKWL